MENKDLLSNPLFKKSCEMAGLPATIHQASKFRRGYGMAMKFKEQALEELTKPQNDIGGGHENT
jgi:hypothetical protein